ncbi:MAG TPA: isochorismatase family cysteine hydrolase [Bryobacteraceae bacterium]|nr:isochorismatase family cysteine hydrolase [Bryobacteraceae bacterium]
MKTVYFDIDTQIDFMFPAGALYASGAERIVRRVGELNRSAAAQGIVVVSTMDAHTENDPEFQQWPPHCVVGTTAQAKPQATLLEKRVIVPSAPAAFRLDGAQQVILEKQTTNCFTNANIQEVLKELQADRYVVYGVVTEVCVYKAAVGLLGTGKRVEILTDAIIPLDPTAGVRALEELRTAGAVVMG